jgi:SAM-dependent methyltransferase
MVDEPTHLKLLPALWQWWKQDKESNEFRGATRRLFCGLYEFLRDSTPLRRRQRYGDVDYDWDHRVDTTGATVGWRERLMGTLHSPYQPTESTLFHEMLDGLKIDFREFTFIDLGSGKGRTLLMASDYPFRRIIGVELFPALHAIAESNISSYKNDSQLCFDLKAVCADARDFEFPATPTLLYLFNPLPAAGLISVLENLKQSLEKSPRTVYILYHNPEHEYLLAKSTFLQKSVGTHQYSLYLANSPSS